jgi:hypothetical protein
VPISRNGSKGKRSRKEKAYFTEITDRAESEGEEASDIILSSDSERVVMALAGNARPAVKEPIAAEWLIIGYEQQLSYDW